jgi:hypothetical protein
MPCRRLFARVANKSAAMSSSDIGVDAELT